MRSLGSVIPFVVLLLALPFVYNSCQGNFLGSGFASSKAVSCKMGLEKGIPTKMEFNSSMPPDPFLSGKVQFGNPPSDVGIKKANKTSAMTLKAGTSLSVIMNNTCFNDPDQTIPENSLRAILYRNTSAISDHLDRQAFEWVLERNYTDNEIRNLAAADDCVIGVSWNQKYQIQAMSFNDSLVSNQAHLGAVRAFDAYDYFYDGDAGMNRSGQALVTIAVIDTGVDYQHPELAGRLWSSGVGFGIDITTQNTPSVNYFPSDLSGLGHGTHVAGLIGALANNSSGTIGLMPFRVQVMPIRVFARNANNELTTTSQHFYNAIQYAYKNGAQVINLSLGSIANGPAQDSIADAAVSEAVRNGAVVIVVIGNSESGDGGLVDGTNISSIPGQYATKSGVIGVGSIEAATGAKSYFSHYSTTYAEIGAPGSQLGNTGILSTIPTSLNSYGQLSGTSQAAPLVSAAAGLTIAMIKKSYNIGPTPAEVERLLLSSAEKSSALRSYFKDGNRLDLVRLAQKIGGDYPQTKKPGMVYFSPSCSK